MFVDRFVMSINECCQAVFRLGGKGSGSSPIVGHHRNNRFIGIRFGDWIEMFLLESTRTASSVATTAAVCYKNVRKNLLS
jgi:hypothetical protein